MVASLNASFSTALYTNIIKFVQKSPPLSATCKLPDYKSRAAWLKIKNCNFLADITNDCGIFAGYHTLYR